MDDEDFERCIKINWCYSGGRVYSSNHITCGKSAFLHRFILGVTRSSKLPVDHINGNQLDNRRCNLRLCYHRRNLQNSKKRLCRTTSIYKGVGFHSKSRKFRAYIQDRKIHIHLGLFKNEIEAAIAYDDKAIELFGEFARLNFPLYGA